MFNVQINKLWSVQQVDVDKIVKNHCVKAIIVDEATDSRTQQAADSDCEWKPKYILRTVFVLNSEMNGGVRIWRVVWDEIDKTNFSPGIYQWRQSPAVGVFCDILLLYLNIVYMNFDYCKTVVLKQRLVF